MASKRPPLAPVPQQAIDLLETLMGWDTPRSGGALSDVVAPVRRDATGTPSLAA